MLFVGFEMTNEEQEERLDAINAGISHTRLRSGRLKAKEEQQLGEAVSALADGPPFLLSSDASAMTTLSGIAAKIDTTKPSIVFIDGVYMMEDEHGERKGSPQALTNITRGLKKLAMARQIPIVISTQALSYKIGKSGITQDAIGLLLLVRAGLRHCPRGHLHPGRVGQPGVGGAGPQCPQG